MLLKQQVNTINFRNYLQIILGNLSLCRAVVDTYYALLVVDPKKEQLAVAEAKLKAAEEVLNEKKR